MNDSYELHRLALAPLLRPNDSDVLRASLDCISGHNSQQFVEFVVQQGLGPLWHQKLQLHNATSLIPDALIRLLASAHREAAAHYLLQKATLRDLRSHLDDAGLVHLVYKGVANRERLYSKSALRPAADIDLLVAPSDRDKAIGVLIAAGFVLHVKPANVSHEVNLQRGAATVDLHWDILRPGRTRVPMVEQLLASRVDAGDHWRVDDAGALYIALVHPVFAKYATAPQSTLIRVVDLLRLLKDESAADRAMQLAERSGVATAAWIMLRWLQRLIGDDVDAIKELTALEHRSAPPALKRRYLDYWVTKNLATQLSGAPAITQAMFTLAAHDTIFDALRALRGAVQAGVERQSATQILSRQCTPDTNRLQGAKP